eukprot:690831-Amphidinium_carterae.1
MLGWNVGVLWTVLGMWEALYELKEQEGEAGEDTTCVDCRVFLNHPVLVESSFLINGEEGSLWR